MQIFEKNWQDQENNGGHKILHGNPNRDKTMGGNNATKIHYDMSEYKTI